MKIAKYTKKINVLFATKDIISKTTHVSNVLLTTVSSVKVKISAKFVIQAFILIIKKRFANNALKIVFIVEIQNIVIHVR